MEESVRQDMKVYMNGIKYMKAQTCVIKRREAGVNKCRRRQGYKSAFPSLPDATS